MSDSTASASLNQLIEQADLNLKRAQEAQYLATIEIRRLNPELAMLLDQLWPDTFKQANWLFKRLSLTPDRPVDLIASGQSSKVHELLHSMLHGLFR